MPLSQTCPQLALGPLQYYWPADTVRDFYADMACAPLDIIYLGETVCSKRKALRTGEWLELAQTLKNAGKEVVLSTLTLLEAEAELNTLRRLCENGEFWIEANDIAAVSLCEGRPFVSGPAVNIYNGRSLEKFARLGLRRFVLPLELSRTTLAALQAERPPGVETEVFVYGRLPLAYAARCFTARAHNLPKDDCQLRCLDYPDGLLLSTQEQSPFLVINGIQTQSARTCNLLPYIADLRALNVDVLRISPQSHHTRRIVETFRAALEGNPPVADLSRFMPVGSCDGYWRGAAGMV
jgi:O2-independent ubiquinone biosynthesis protein UbiV